MQIKITTWNINSVRFRIDLVAKFLKGVRPDVLCLQETKCPDDKFPHKRFARLGYAYRALNGQKGYHGVAVLSRLPFESTLTHTFCGQSDSRHLAVVLGERAGLRDQVTLHNFYVPAGGDEPDPSINPKFAHKLGFLDEMSARAELRPSPSDRAILVGDLNVAPLEHDVWSHKRLIDVVSHTPIECEKLVAALRAGSWIDTMRAFVPEPTKLYTWWSYRAPDWGGRAATGRPGRGNPHHQTNARLGTPLRSRAGDGDAGGLIPSSSFPKPSRARLSGIQRRFVRQRPRYTARTPRTGCPRSRA